MGRLFLLILYHFSDNPFVAVSINPHVEPFKSREQVFILSRWCALLGSVFSIGHSPKIFGGLHYREWRAVGGVCIVCAQALWQILEHPVVTAVGVSFCLGV